MLKDKIATAQESTWLREGLTDDEAREIVESAQRKVKMHHSKSESKYRVTEDEFEESVLLKDGFYHSHWNSKMKRYEATMITVQKIELYAEDERDVQKKLESGDYFYEKQETTRKIIEQVRQVDMSSREEVDLRRMVV